MSTAAKVLWIGPFAVALVASWYVDGLGMTAILARIVYFLGGILAGLAISRIAD